MGKLVFAATKERSPHQIAKAVDLRDERVKANGVVGWSVSSCFDREVDGRGGADNDRVAVVIDRDVQGLVGAVAAQVMRVDQAWVDHQFARLIVGRKLKRYLVRRGR